MKNTFQDLYDDIRNLYQSPEPIDTIWYLTYNKETGKPKDITVDPKDEPSVVITKEQAESFINTDPFIKIIDGKIIKEVTYRTPEETPNRLFYKKDPSSNFKVWNKSMLIIKENGIGLNESKN